MSLDVYLEKTMLTDVYSAKITHNLGSMAKEAGIYSYLWRPDEIGITRAHELIAPLTEAVKLMESNPGRFKAHNPPNGWGDYEGFLRWIKEYLDACKENPGAEIKVSR